MGPMFLLALGNWHVANLDRGWRVDSVSLNGPDPLFLFQYFIVGFLLLLFFTVCLFFFLWFILGSGILYKIIGSENYWKKWSFMVRVFDSFLLLAIFLICKDNMNAIVLDNLTTYTRMQLYIILIRNFLLIKNPPNLFGGWTENINFFSPNALLLTICAK